MRASTARSWRDELRDARRSSNASEMAEAARRASVAVAQIQPKKPRRGTLALIGIRRRSREVAAPKQQLGAELHVVSSDGPQPLIGVPIGATAAIWAVKKGTDPGQLMAPRTVVAYNGAIFVSDVRNGRVEAFHPRNGAHLRTVKKMQAPVGMLVHEGHLYVTSWADHRVHKLRLPDGGVPPARARSQQPVWAAEEVAAWGGHGEADGQFKCPSGLAYTNDELVVVDRLNHRLQFFGTRDVLSPQEHRGIRPQGETDGAFRHLRSFGSRGRAPGQFIDPWGVKAHEGLLYVVDSGNSRVQVLTPRGALVDVLTLQNASLGLRDLDISADGKRIYVADRDRCCVHEVTAPAAGSSTGRDGGPSLA